MEENKKFKFDVIIGNPPYQEIIPNNGRMNPIYNYFMDQSLKVSKISEFITPARFLFNAGQTPKEWNEKMLNDEHLKVVFFEPDSNKVFPALPTPIKGGVCVTLRNEDINYGKIGMFTRYPLLTSIIKKVVFNNKQYQSLDSIISARGHYRLSDKAFEENPDIVDEIPKGTGNMIASNIFEKLSSVFVDATLNKSTEQYFKILGRAQSTRQYKYVKKDYLIPNPYATSYNVVIPEANYTGKFGEKITKPIIIDPGCITSDTYISVGCFKDKQETLNCSKYIQTKFVRALLGAKKVTQHTSKSTWQYVPLVNFAVDSDINWKSSIHDIDLQLYKKYALTREEILFIETNVEEMA